jgi:hypothetical protein
LPLAVLVFRTGVAATGIEYECMEYEWMEWMEYEWMEWMEYEWME